MSWAILAVRIYQALDHTKHQVLLTVFGYSAVCKHRPTCSEYAVQQIKQHGTILGSLKAFQRILTCW